MTDVTLLTPCQVTPCQGEGCDETVWLESEPEGPCLVQLFDQHLHMIEGPDGDDETVFLCDDCGWKLTSGGREVPDWSLGARLRGSEAGGIAP